VKESMYGTAPRFQIVIDPDAQFALDSKTKRCLAGNSAPYDSGLGVVHGGYEVFQKLRFDVWKVYSYK